MAHHRTETALRRGERVVERAVVAQCLTLPTAAEIRTTVAAHLDTIGVELSSSHWS